MLFTSPVFLFLFLPAVLALYYLLPGVRLRNALLVLASLFFYSWGEPAQCWLILASIAINYLLALAVDGTNGAARKTILGFGIFINLCVLGWYKYADFILGNINQLIANFGAAPLPLPHPGLPLGISFFTFHSISYLIDVFRRTSTAQRNPLTMALYISLFPQLLAGPIIRYKDISSQFTQRRESISYFHQGIQRFVNGLAKKVLIANALAVNVDKIFALPAADLSTGLAWLAALGFMLQIYFDFSGYSDMAIGLAYMFGFRFPENFNFPYMATSIRDFWRRWHISLSTWFRDYVYLPMGGNRVPKVHAYFNLVLIFFLCGLWHGASWKFIIWGLYHGFFLVLERTPAGAFLERIPIAFQRVYVWLTVMIGWILFRADNMPQVTNMLSHMFTYVPSHTYPVRMFLTNDIAFIMVLGLIFSFPTARAIVTWLGGKTCTQDACAPIPRVVPLRALRTIWLSAIFLVCISEASAMAYRPFLYFRF